MDYQYPQKFIMYPFNQSKTNKILTLIIIDLLKLKFKILEHQDNNHL